MSLATTIVKNAGSVNTNHAAEIDVSAKKDQAPQQHVQIVKENTGNKNELTPQLNLKELELALQNAVKNTRFSYRLNDKIDMVVVKIIDKQTQEIIRELPGEEIQRLHENLQEAIGLLFDTEI
ncbi:MAG: flagellar protein FlaG [Spirochaetales bacterium]|nr:flagellar protein FlaG [Spirochaetales bacterium]